MKRTAPLVATMVIALVLASGAALTVPKQQARAAFPGEDGRIAFVSARDGDADIYTVGFGGNNLKRLTHNSRPDSAPSWSANGKKIVFASRVKGFSYLYTMASDGSDLRRVSDRFGGYEPAFSPSGRKVVFSACNSLYTINVDGSDLRRLTNLGCSNFEDQDFEDNRPEWSPDGKTIAFDRQFGLGIQVLNLSDSSPRTVVSGCSNVEDPDWSPDGTWLAYASREQDCAAGLVADSEIRKVSAAGTGDVALTDDPAHDAEPAFSPGGGHIVFTSNRDGDFDLYVMRADGTGARQLTNTLAKERAPDWQPVP